MKHIVFAVALASMILLVGCRGTDTKENTELQSAVQTERSEIKVDPDNTNSIETAPASSEGLTTETAPQQEPSPDKEPIAEPEKSSATQASPEKANPKSEANVAVVDSILVKNDKVGKPDTTKAAEYERLRAAVSAMRTFSKEIKQQAEAEELIQVKAVSEQLAQEWASSKQLVKAGFPDMHEFLDTRIDNLAKLVIAEEVDIKAIVELDYQIYQAFRQLSEKMEGG
jgi:hypothetical protein